MSAHLIESAGPDSGVAIMIEPIHGMPDGAIGFTASGTITAADYENVIMPAVEALHARTGKIRFLYHLGDAFEGFSAGALWDDARLGAAHLSGWERVALVSDIDWLRGAIRLLGVAIPGDVRVFANDELQDAIHWVGE